MRDVFKDVLAGVDGDFGGWDNLNQDEEMWLYVINQIEYPFGNGKQMEIEN